MVVIIFICNTLIPIAIKWHCWESTYTVGICCMNLLVYQCSITTKLCWPSLMCWGWCTLLQLWCLPFHRHYLYLPQSHWCFVAYWSFWCYWCRWLAASSCLLVWLENVQGKSIPDLLSCWKNPASCSLQISFPNVAIDGLQNPDACISIVVACMEVYTYYVYQNVQYLLCVASKFKCLSVVSFSSPMGLTKKIPHICICMFLPIMTNFLIIIHFTFFPIKTNFAYRITKMCGWNQWGAWEA